MKRLTGKHIECMNDFCCKTECELYDDCPALERYNRLAHYEDMEEQGRLLVLPCCIGTHLWKVTHPYRQEPKVTEFVVKNFRTAGKRHQLQLEVQAVNTPGTNWMPFSAFMRTREEAERALEGGAKNATT